MHRAAVAGQGLGEELVIRGRRGDLRKTAGRGALRLRRGGGRSAVRTICAAHPSFGSPAFGEYSGSEVLSTAHPHCDLVVGKPDQTLEAIGGNVRNSVSKSVLELDAEGRLQSTPRRPWFLVLQNRL